MMAKSPQAATHVDSHTLFRLQPNIIHLGDIPGSLHVSSITTRTEDNGDLGVWVDVVGGNQSTGGIVDQSQKFGVNILIYQLKPEGERPAS